MYKNEQFESKISRWRLGTVAMVKGAVRCLSLEICLKQALFNFRMGDKVAARLAATSAGLSIIPGTEFAVTTTEVKFYLQGKKLIDFLYLY